MINHMDSSFTRMLPRLLWPLLFAFGLGLLLWPIYSATAVSQAPTALTPEFNTNEPNPTSNSPFTVTLSFTETVFAPSAFITENTTLEMSPAIGFDDTFILTLTPLSPGYLTVTLPATATTSVPTGTVIMTATFSIEYQPVVSAPFPTTINQKAGTPDPTNGDAIFTVIFGEPISVTTFTADDIDLSTSTAPGTAVISLIETAPHDGTTFEVTVSATDSGVIMAMIPENVVEDLVGNLNEASTSDDNSVTIDKDALGVVLAWRVGQGDPTNTNPLLVITFTKPITAVDFPINLTGSEAQTPTVVSLTETAPGTRFTAELTAAGDGVITAVVDAGVATDEAGNPNLASNEISITYDTTPPVITLNGAPTVTMSLNTSYIDEGATAVDNIDGLITDTIQVDTSGLITTAVGTYAVTYTVSDRAGNQASATRTVIVQEHVAYLPFIAKLLPGEIQLDTNGRAAGVTIFTRQATLNFSNIGFVGTPNEMKLWLAGEAIPNDWQTYVSTPSFEVANLPGELQTIHVVFRQNGSEIGTKSIMVFYLPNGDFVDDTLGGWAVTENNLPVSIQNGHLRLGDTHDVFGCSNVPFPASALVALSLNLPAGTTYQLQIRGTVYTQDQLPNPQNTQYDAFEVVLNGTVAQRFGSPQGGLSCNTMREVPVVFTQSISGNTQLSLENHSRFDNFYNTYTEVDQVWLEIGD